MPKPNLDFKTFEQNLKDTADYLYPWEKQARKDFQFYALKQWDSKDVERLEKELRPALTFDRTRPIIDSVSGSEITSRYEPKFFPRNATLMDVDSAASEAMSEVYRWVRQQADIEHEESAAFHDAILCGVGCIETYLSRDENPDGRIMGVRVPVFEMGWDKSSVQPCMKDAHFIFREKWVPRQELEMLFGADAIDEVIRISRTETGPRWAGFGGIFTEGRDRSQEAYSYKRGRSYYDDRAQKAHLWVYQWWERHFYTRVFVPLPDGEVDEVWLEKEKTQSGMEELRALLPDETVELDFIEDVPKKHFFQAYMAGKSVLKQEELPTGDFTYQFLTAYEDFSEEDAKHYFGLMRPMRDPQQYANKFFSQAVHMWNSNGKGAILYERSLFEDPSQAAEDWASPVGMIPVEDGSFQGSNPRYEVIRNQVSFAGIESMVSHANTSIPLAAGVNQAYFVGGSEDLRRTANQLVENVQQQNLVTLSVPFDAFKLYKKRHARVVMDLVREYLPDGTIMRILGPEGAQAAPLVKESLVEEYDVVVDQAPTSRNQRMEVFSRLMETNFIPQLIQAGIPIPPSLAKYFPFPEEINGEFQKVLEFAMQMAMMGGQPPPEEVQ